jgi:ribosome-binding factor A
VAEAIREVVSMAILADLKDPRVQDVTVTYVEVSGDLRHAKVHVSVMGGEAKQKLSLRGLQSAAGYLQSRCADRIETRYTPRIEFVLDQGVKKSIEIAQILKRVLPREEVPGEADTDGQQRPAGPGPLQPTASEVRHPPPDDPSDAPGDARPAS